MNTPQPHKWSDPWAEVKRLQAENEQLKKQYDEAVYLMNQASLEFNKAKAQLAATEEALAQVQRESAELREERDELIEEVELCRGDASTIVKKLEEFKAAKKVADAAVEYMQFNGSVRDHIQFGAVLFAAVRHYLDVTSPLSPAKQSAVDAAIERQGKENNLDTRRD